MKDLKTLFSGRMNRKPFFGWFCLILLIRIGLGFIVLTNLRSFLSFSALIWSAHIIDLMVSIIALWALVKRLHDLNWPTILAFLPLLYTILGFDILDFKVLEKLVQWVMSALVICALFMKGDKGQNKYGDDPLETSK